MVRLTAEAAKASQRADDAKRRVKLVKAELKKARKLAKTAKKVAKQARKRAAALASAPGGVKTKAAVRAAPTQASRAVKPARARSRSRVRMVAHRSPAAAVARSVITRMASVPPEAPVVTPRAPAQTEHEVSASPPPAG